MLACVPLAGAGREMAGVDGQAGIVGQLLELVLPGAGDTQCCRPRRR